jgi:peptidoglycan/xylan/chitin deacetylase (PgdA/CDA1 family)
MFNEQQIARAHSDADFQLAEEAAAPYWPIVLYFHHVSPTINHFTSVTPSDFRRGLELCLRLLGPAMSPEQIELMLQCRAPGPQFLVTFDDGYSDVIEHALPIMDDLEIGAVHFLIADAVRYGCCEGISTPRAGFIGTKDLAELIYRGHRLGEHSRTHRPMNALGIEEVNDEIASHHFQFIPRKQDQCRLFAYPYGIQPLEQIHFDEMTLEFGTIKAKPVPWTDRRHPIRRTYLPRGNSPEWPGLIAKWKRKWQI